ncbi:hypothetical protein ACFZCU_45900 [Streptomyces canus]|uniref:hypothetical protein n=1 Tax=Streptomyces canus TaxID=58343 RepID=UPI0036EAC7D8
MTREQILNLPRPLRIAVQLVAPTGQHRPRGAIVDTRFVDCTPCGVSTVASVHGGTVLCAEGHQQPVGGAQ